MPRATRENHGMSWIFVHGYLFRARLPMHAGLLRCDAGLFVYQSVPVELAGRLMVDFGSRVHLIMLRDRDPWENVSFIPPLRGLTPGKMVIIQSMPTYIIRMSIFKSLATRVERL